MNNRGLLRLGGLVAIAAAFWLQAGANASNAASRLAGGGTSDAILPWVIGGAGIVAIIASFLVTDPPPKDPNDESPAPH